MTPTEPAADVTGTEQPRKNRPSVLVPLKVLEGEQLPNGIAELLANAHIVLLGYHVLPEQTPPGQARMQFEDRAQQKLGEFEAVLEGQGASVERRLVFTHSAQMTIKRTIAEHGCLAVLVPNGCESPTDILVPIRGTVGVSRIVRLVAGLFAETDVTVTLYHGLVDDESSADAETFLNGVGDQLENAGLDESAIEFRIDDTEKIDIDRIADVAPEYDAVIMGESDPSVTTFVFGEPSRQIAKRFLGPVLVVQREKSTKRSNPRSNNS